MAGLHGRNTTASGRTGQLCRRLADKGVFRQLDGDHQHQVATWCLQEAFRNCGNARRLTQAGYKQAARPGWPSYTLATKALGASSWIDACRSCGVPAGDPLDYEFVERVVSKMEVTVEKPVDPGLCLVARPTGEVKRWYDWNRRC